MEQIYETNANFPFEQLRLMPPTVLAGGNYFIKYLIDGAPLYIQPPKCSTKQGITKGGKRFFTDLMFTNDHADFIQWLEQLESHTCKRIFENREQWFETSMEMHDIENYLTSPLKVYKSGKNYLVRTNIPSRLGKITLKIYDESEQDVDPETIRENTQVISIMEVQGIKCSLRSFQIELELKQMMVVKPSNLFDKCIIRAKPGETNPAEASAIITNTVVQDNITLGKEEDVDVDVDEDHSDPVMEEVDAAPYAPYSVTKEDEEETKKVVEEEAAVVIANSIVPQRSTELSEVNIDLDILPEEDSMQLKRPNEVYYEMYREARKKAKEARDLALRAYLEAKQIKNTYLLDDINDDEDSDLEDGDEDEDEDEDDA